MAVEPPPGYVAFVEAHLDPLRRQAEQVSADPLDADRLSTDVLTDVAARWAWLELARTRFGRTDAAERYLERSIGRRTARPDVEPDPAVEFDVWPDSPVASAAEPAIMRPASGGPGPWFAGQRTNAAVRLAQQAPSLFTVALGPLVEAAVAWQHAYAAARRRRLTARLALVFLLVVALVRLRYHLSSGGVE